jgi:hypothetical protein
VYAAPSDPASTMGERNYILLMFNILQSARQVLTLRRF